MLIEVELHDGAATADDAAGSTCRPGLLFRTPPPKSKRATGEPVDAQRCDRVRHRLMVDAFREVTEALDASVDELLDALAAAVESARAPEKRTENRSARLRF